MDHINGFLRRLKNTLTAQADKKQIISSVCLERAGVQVQPNQIVIQNRTIKLNISPAAKSAIFLGKSAILKDLEQKMQPFPIDIR